MNMQKKSGVWKKSEVWNLRSLIVPLSLKLTKSQISPSKSTSKLA